jgi:hypothetical protein
MTIDPRYSVILSLFLAIMSFLSGASANLTDAGLDPLTVKHVLAWVAILVGIGNCINAVLGAIPSKSDPASLNKFWLGPKPPESK